MGGVADRFVQDIVDGRKASVRGDENLMRLATVLETSPHWLLGIDPTVSGALLDAPERLQTFEIPVRGTVEAGRWAEARDEARDADPEGVETLTVAGLRGYSQKDLYALRVSGNSMNLEYSEGTMLIVAPASVADVYEGDHVIVMRRQGALAETTVKELTHSKTGAWELRARSTDPSFSTPWPLKDEGDETPQIIGVVLGAMKLRRRTSRMHPS